jgi:hypothetical protein
MNFIINESNIELLNYLNTLSELEQNNFINQILKIGFQEFNKNKIQNHTHSIQDSFINIFDNKLDNLKLLINEIKLEQHNNMLQLNTNNTKGALGEQLIYEFFKQNNYHVDDTSGIAHSGDMCLYLEEINQNVLIEIKNYKNSVDQKQIDKFYYDLNYTGIKLGIFISLQSKIVNIKYPIEWKINEVNEILIFISECKEEYLYLAIYSLILLFKKTNYKSNLQLIEHTEIYNDIKYLSNQKDSINKIKQDILSIHENYTKSILTLYNNLCTFDNNFNYILNKIYNRLDKEFIMIDNNKLYLESMSLNIPNNIKEILDIIISDLNAVYKLEFIDQKKIKITKNDKNIGEIKILKTTINLILDSGLELKNINKENWNQILNLINS